MQGVSESLAGRAGIINLLGLSSSEINGVSSTPFDTDAKRLMQRAQEVPKIGLKDLYERIFLGSMPRLYAEKGIDWESYYRSYVMTYLQRDIRDLTQVADEMAFLDFMTVVAARTSKPVIYEELASEVGISAPTAKKWISLLLSTRLVALVQPYHNDILKRVVKMPVMYFLDTGLCAYLLKWTDPETLERGAMSGALFETHVFAEIYKSYLNAGREPPLYYYRDKDKKEIDLLICENGVVSPIEIKKSASPGTGAIKNFRALAPIERPDEPLDAADEDDAGNGLAANGTKDLESLKVTIGTGVVVCMINDILPINEKNWYIPAGLI
jgi:predicted AAA+ superfamily ATPase